MDTERIRQAVTGSLNFDEIEKLQKQGWIPVSIEWERPSPAAASPPQLGAEEPPYGLQVAHDCATLEEHPDEANILMTMMELIIEDGPYSFVAQELNRKGFQTREGSKWSPVSVFEMLPRLIEAGPKIFSSGEWVRRR